MGIRRTIPEQCNPLSGYGILRLLKHRLHNQPLHRWVMGLLLADLAASILGSKPLGDGSGCKVGHASCILQKLCQPVVIFERVSVTN
jgi:hypothetical protein